MYRIKQVPEDFIVKEAIKPKLDKNGKYSYFRLKKTNWTTISALRAIANALRKDLDDFGWAGNKDKHAVTEQLVSLRNVNEAALKNIKIKDIDIRFIGRGNEPITLGRNIGNKFEILVRNLDAFKKSNIACIPNYFDEQRFSTNNVEIGRAMVKRNFDKAINLILQSIFADKEFIEKQLKTNPRDLIGALKIIPRKMLMLYLHAYQSYIFNELVKRHLKKTAKSFKVVKTSFGDIIFPKQKVKNAQLPIVGFGTAPDSLLLQILKEERLSPRDFIFREFPELSSEGGNRDLLINIKGLKIGKQQKDELNIGKQKVKLSFELPKGCYATIVIKAFF